MKTQIDITSHEFGTVAFWRDYRRRVAAYSAATWQGAAIKFAKQHGRAIVMLANDDFRVYERTGDTVQGYRQKLIPRERVELVGAWSNSEKRAI